MSASGVLQRAAPSAATATLRPRIEMVVIQPTPFCNIACRYCYLPDRNSRAVMTQDTVRRSFAEIFASGLAHPELTVVWHAGEPLVVPVEFYRTAFATIEALRPPHIRVRHSFQTNGMLLSPEWCDLIRDWQVTIGISVDGPRHIHDANRVTRSGGGTFDRTMAGLRLLRAEAIPFHALSVLTADSLGAAHAMYEFYVAEGIAQVCFNVEESEGTHVSGMFAQADLYRRFRGFLETFWQLSRAGHAVCFVREIDSMIPRIFRPAERAMHNPQVEPLALLNIDHTGKVSTFSPELLGYKDAAYDDFIIGDIHRDSLAAMLDTCLRSPMARDIAAGVERCRTDCGYFSVCGGGAPVNKLSEAGRFDATRTSFCTLTQIAPTDMILAALDRLEPIDARTVPAPAPAASLRTIP